MFGCKKRKKARALRVEAYKEEYSALSKEERKDFLRFWTFISSQSMFRNQMVVDHFQAAGDVEREETE